MTSTDSDRSASRTGSPEASETAVDEPTRTDTSHPKTYAAGVPAVAVSMKRGFTQMGPLRTAKTFLELNQRHGFDCPGCAWPEKPGGRKPAEFCENGAKAVAEEATRRRVTPDFFATHSVAELRERSEYWLSQQGRITHPMLLRDGGTHYEPIDWADAYRLIGDELAALGSPDEAVFYTSGRTSNEAAFVYQLFARSLGTNNLPDCSNMCHESSGHALSTTIGIGKGSVSVLDVENADLILIAGQNPGTNHPRMLSILGDAKRNGAKIVAINPLPEAGLMRFRDPQRPGDILGAGTTLADEFLQVRLGGDMALFRGLAALLLRAENANPGTVFDHDFLETYCSGVEDYLALVADTDMDEIYEATGLRPAELETLAQLWISSDKTIVCWAMGLTQHKHAVATIEEVTNTLLLSGMMGKPGAGVCPVRGHSNVQGDRTMGIWEQMPESFLAAVDSEFGITSPREVGYDVVDALRAMRDGKVGIFMSMGGNFVSATPDTEVTKAAMARCRLTVQVSTKLNASHLATGDTALILPTLGRTDRDIRDGKRQLVTVEDSMGSVHLSRGSLTPSSDCMRSEVGIICELAETVLGSDHAVDWSGLASDYDRIRDHVAAVVPGFENFNDRVRQPDGFLLPHPPRDSREFPTDSGKAVLTVNDLEWLPTPQGRLILQTLRSHDQYNTTIYGHDDRYRGIKGNRRIIMVNPDDLAELGLVDDQPVSIVSEFEGAGGLEERRVDGFRVVSYPTPRGNAAAYYPETNPLVPLDHVATKSNTPVSKGITVRLVAVP
ncbi:FdhF/YdeP family oxidoreductase [Williamsia maris]|uniref:Oxidoreductase alpha (Molybdopterin) subunit n=1 Tax=Williamsia maris TaxID=72806 RepID=A0ABT1HL24_9NOCA|nr:FdhF/YdeP family oxidoreductase [Williamsia maris]MCP2178643.1 oxidoreductase alpha (molybdopterin) subunit [Williamsia maris]